MGHAGTSVPLTLTAQQILDGTDMRGQRVGRDLAGAD